MLPAALVLLSACTGGVVTAPSWNQPPSVTSVSIGDGPYTEESTITAVTRGWYDLEGAPERYVYTWARNGELLSDVTGAGIDGASFAKGDSVCVTVTPFDGTDMGTPVTSSTVTIQNSAPVANADAFTTLEDTGIVIDLEAELLANDADADGEELTPAIVRTPFDGVLTIAGNVVSYLPAADFVGEDSFAYLVSDGAAVSSPATVTITVASVNDPPSFSMGAELTTVEDAGEQTMTGWATSIMAGPTDEAAQTLAFAVTHDRQELFAVQPAIASDGTLTYAPAGDANGSVAVTVVLQDSGGTADGGSATSGAQSFLLTIRAVNDPPAFVKGGDVLVAEDAGPQALPGWAAALSPGAADETAQALSFTVSTDNDALFFAGPLVSAGGQLSFTSAADANGASTVTLRLRDDGGIADGGGDTSQPQTFNVVVTAVNDAPSFIAGADVSVAEDTGAHVVSGWATGLCAGPAGEQDQTLSFLVGNDNPTLFAVEPVIDTAGTLSFTLAPDAFGIAVVTVRLQDDGGIGAGGVDTSAPHELTIDVANVPDPPFAADGMFFAFSGPSAGGALDGGDVDREEVTFSLVAAPPAGEGTVAVDASGTFTFTAAAGFTGATNFTFETHDGTSGSSIATATVRVFPVQPLGVGSGYSAAIDASTHRLYAWGLNTSGQLGIGTAGAEEVPTPTPEAQGFADWAVVELGGAHACGIRAGGALYCWGQGGYVDGSAGLVTAPREIDAPFWKSVSAGGFATCGVKADGTLWCWGSNGFGQLGLGDMESRPAPTQVGAYSGWQAVAAGLNFACGIRAGALYCWGRATNGQLGLGDTTARLQPAQVGLATDWVQVATTSMATHACAINAGGELFCWGWNLYGQLGDGSTNNALAPRALGGGFVGVGLSEHATCAVMADGNRYCFGNNASGQFGNGTFAASFVPAQATTDGAWSAAIAGDGTPDHFCGIRSDATLWCWGSNKWGATGAGYSHRRLAPVRVGSSSDWQRVVGAHTDHTCALKGAGADAGKLFCWGSNDYGQLGLGDRWPRPAPTKVQDTITDWVDVEVGQDSACGVRATGELYCWGDNASGQLGLGDTASRVLPALQSSGWRTTSADVLAVGAAVACAIKADGSLWCWGANDHGQVGSGSAAAAVLAPEQVMPGTLDWVVVSARRDHVCGIRDVAGSRTLWCWGQNNGHGKLGDGTTGDRSTPVQVGTQTDWLQAAPAGETTCGIRAGGELWCWGEDSHGQLADGVAQAGSMVPTRENSGAADWIEVSGASATYCGLRADGSGWCWGANADGAVGDGTMTDRDAVTGLGLGSWVSVAAGVEHACGVLAGGGLYCWGTAERGQTGDGSTWKQTPVPIVLP